jgi:hypothetical protein
MVSRFSPPHLLPPFTAQLVPAHMANHNQPACFGCPLPVRAWPHQSLPTADPRALVAGPTPMSVWLQVVSDFVNIVCMLVPNFQFRVKKTQNVMCRIGCIRCLLLRRWKSWVLWRRSGAGIRVRKIGLMPRGCSLWRRSGSRFMLILDLFEIGWPSNIAHRRNEAVRAVWEAEEAATCSHDGLTGVE